MAARNLELKVPFEVTTDRLGALRRLGAVQAATLNQVDTYFAARHGRLKLREVVERSADGSQKELAELIAYNRPDASGVRTSDYVVARLADAAGCLAALSASLGVAGVVRKRRQLWLWENVRIHLDDVEQLGSFLEFEAVIGPNAEERVSVERLDRLIAVLKIDRGQTLQGSYRDLLAAKKWTSHGRASRGSRFSLEGGSVCTFKRADQLAQNKEGRHNV